MNVKISIHSVERFQEGLQAKTHTFLDGWILPVNHYCNRSGELKPQAAEKPQNYIKQYWFFLSAEAFKEIFQQSALYRVRSIRIFEF